MTDQDPSIRQLVQTVTRVNASHIGDEGFVSLVHDHHVDSIESIEKGKYDAYYDYDVYLYSDGSTTLMTRSYSYRPKTACLISFETADGNESLNGASLKMPLVRVAIQHLRSIGKTELLWLNVDGKGDPYTPVPDIGDNCP